MKIKSKYSEGYDACMSGESHRSCPYPYGSFAYKQWRKGWLAASKLDLKPAYK